MRMEGQGWGDMGPVEEVKVLLRPPTSDRADCSRPSPLLVSDGGFQGGATPKPSRNHPGATGCDAGRERVPWSLAQGASAQGGRPSLRPLTLVWPARPLE